MHLWPVICHTDATCVKICQKLSLVREKIQLSLASLPHRNSDHKIYGLEKNHDAGASVLIVHGKTVMFERSCQRSGSLRRKQRENAHVSWICDLHGEIDKI